MSEKTTKETKRDPWALEGKAPDPSKRKVLSDIGTLVRLREKLTIADSTVSSDMLIGDSYISVQKGIVGLDCIHKYRYFDRHSKKYRYWAESYLKEIIKLDIGSYQETKASFLLFIRNMGGYLRVHPNGLLKRVENKIIEPDGLFKLRNFKGISVDCCNISKGVRALIGDCFISINNDVKQLYLARQNTYGDNLRSFISFMVDNGIGECHEHQNGLTWWVFDIEKYKRICNKNIDRLQLGRNCKMTAQDYPTKEFELPNPNRIREY